jgi:hypothetical protein
MNPTICLATKQTLQWPKAAGHFWVYLNWALGLQALGCRVIWLERVTKELETEQVPELVRNLKCRLERYGLGSSLALVADNDASLPEDVLDGCNHFDEALEADLLLNLAYDIPDVGSFRRSALVDIDPGLTQVWMSSRNINIPTHDVYFTIGETVGQPDALFPDCGVRWHYIPPLVYLPAWPVISAAATAAFTTVTNWWGGWVEFQGESYENSKRAGFLPFLDLPQHTTVPLELAICVATGETGDRTMLEEQGWQVQDAWDATSTPWDYHSYIRASFGEFSCAKPSCVRLQNAWISDRTLCYLASGKPVVVQDTGPSRFLPDRGGLFRFRDVDQAAQCLDAVAIDYERQCRLARELAEEHFDAKKVISRVLEKALG